MQKSNTSTGTEEDHETEPLLLGIPMYAHRTSWRLGGAPTFYVLCAEAGMDLSEFKRLDDVYNAYVRITKDAKSN
jgi:hypothetical protein